MIVQLPAVTKVKAPPEVIVQTPVVEEEKVTAKVELAVALNVGVVPKLWGPGLLNVIVWLAGAATYENAPAANTR